MKLYTDRCEGWIGYRADDAHHRLCLLPFVVARWDRRPTNHDTDPVAEAIAEAVAANSPPPANKLLFGPPMVGESTLRDWLIHHHQTRDNVWAEVVSEFYSTAAADRVIADYFRGVDLAELQRHFLSALMMITSTGLTVGALRRMQKVHRNVCNSRGEGVTPLVYDTVVGVLAQILTEKGVPAQTLGQLGPTLQALRDVIAVEPAA